MARKRKEIVTEKKTASRLGKFDFAMFNLGDSYMSLLLGIIVVIIMALIAVSVARSKKVPVEQHPTPAISSSSTSAEQEGQTEKLTEVRGGKPYTVASGDTLWSIAEKTYNSGYNWVDIAKANNIQTPDIIAVGQKVVLPNVDKKEPTEIQAGQNNSSPPASTIQGTSYTVKKGDYLWEISVRAYGDGFRWVEIARVNNLSQPNIIHTGNILKIPR